MCVWIVREQFSWNIRKSQNAERRIRVSAHKSTTRNRNEQQAISWFCLAPHFFISPPAKSPLRAPRHSFFFFKKTLRNDHAQRSSAASSNTYHSHTLHRFRRLEFFASHFFSPPSLPCAWPTNSSSFGSIHFISILTTNSREENGTCPSPTLPPRAPPLRDES